MALPEAPMGITGMANVGEGAVTLGFAARKHEAAFRCRHGKQALQHHGKPLPAAPAALP